MYKQSKQEVSTLDCIFIFFFPNVFYIYYQVYRYYYYYLFSFIGITSYSFLFILLSFLKTRSKRTYRKGVGFSKFILLFFLYYLVLYFIYFFSSSHFLFITFLLFSHYIVIIIYGDYLTSHITIIFQTKKIRRDIQFFLYISSFLFLLFQGLYIIYQLSVISISGQSNKEFIFYCHPFPFTQVPFPFAIWFATCSPLSAYPSPLALKSSIILPL